MIYRETGGKKRRMLTARKNHVSSKRARARAIPTYTLPAYLELSLPFLFLSFSLRCFLLPPNITRTPTILLAFLRGSGPCPDIRVASSCDIWRVPCWNALFFPRACPLGLLSGRPSQLTERILQHPSPSMERAYTTLLSCEKYFHPCLVSVYLPHSNTARSSVIVVVSVVFSPGICTVFDPIETTVFPTWFQFIFQYRDKRSGYLSRPTCLKKGSMYLFIFLYHVYRNYDNTALFIDASVRNKTNAVRKVHFATL